MNILCSSCYQLVFWRTVRDMCDQDAYVITLLKPLWLIHPSLFLISSSYGGRSSGEIRCFSSSVWRRESLCNKASGMYQMPLSLERSGVGLPLPETMWLRMWLRMWLTSMKYFPLESGKAQMIEQIWEEYFADPSQWWDNRVDKVSLGLPDSWC